MDDEQEVMNSKEAGEFLRVSPETVIREARGGRLPGRRVGKEWRFSRGALMEWLARGPSDEDMSRYRREGPGRPPVSREGAGQRLGDQA